MNIAIFSKHLQFLEGDALAARAKALGFDGIDLTVRKGGHVEPERVRQDLPPLIATMRRHGLETPMITTDIADAETPFAADILGVMKDLEIRFYRWGGFRWEKGPLPPQIERLRTRSAKLADMNAKFGVTAMYHTHSGAGLVGASIWDLHEILRGLNPEHVGVNYDIGHATIEGGAGGWINSFRITGPHVRGIAMKDFRWEKDANGRWREGWCPIGEGMVHFPQFFAMVREANFTGPMQLHFEYPLGGAQDGKRKDLTMGQDEIFAAMGRDLTALRTLAEGK